MTEELELGPRDCVIVLREGGDIEVLNSKQTTPELFYVMELLTWLLSEKGADTFISVIALYNASNAEKGEVNDGRRIQ